MKKFDPTKPVRCKNGDGARIIAMDVPGEEGPIAAVVGECVRRYHINGSYYSKGNSSGHDLENIPAKGTVKGFANIYSEGDVRVHATLERAKSNASSGLLARVAVEIEYTEGEGL